MLLKVLNFSNDVAIVNQIDRCNTLVKDWDMHCCAAVFEEERHCVEGAQASNVIGEINDHSSGLNEYKAYNCIDHDVRASGNKDAGGLARAGEVGEVKLKAHSQLGRGKRLSATLNNNQEDDWGVIIGNVVLGKAMQKFLCGGRNKVEVASGEGGHNINNAAKDQNVCGVGVAAKLKLDVREVCVNQCRKDIAVDKIKTSITKMIGSTDGFLEA